MPSQKDAVLAKLAVERGYLTQEQADEAFDIQRKMLDEMGVDQSLEPILVGKHWLTADQAQEIRNAAAVETGEARLVAGYEAIAKLGQGGMGAVYKARRVDTEELVALKILPPSLADKEMIARFTRESEIVRKLHHRNIVGCIEFGFDPKRRVHFCALELVDGEDLGSRIERLGALSEDEAASITTQIAGALQHAYFNSLIHRDVKPDNIMITPDGTAKLLDLGLARPASTEATRMTASGMFVGSPYYASPEQALGEKELDTRADIYALGATLYHMVTGRPPFEGATALAILQKHVTEKLPWPAEVNPELSDGLCRIIAKMMEKEPEDRYQTPNDLHRDLDLLIEGNEPEIDDAAFKNSSVTVPAVRRKRRRRPAARAKHGKHLDHGRRLPGRPQTGDSAREIRKGIPGKARRRSTVPAGVKIGIPVVAGAVVLAVVGVILAGREAPDGPPAESKTTERPPAIVVEPPAPRPRKVRKPKRKPKPRAAPPVTKPKPPRPGPARRTAADAFREAETYNEANPQDIAGAIVLYEQVASEFPGTPESAQANMNVIRLLSRLKTGEEAAAAAAGPPEPWPGVWAELEGGKIRSYGAQVKDSPEASGGRYLADFTHIGARLAVELELSEGMLGAYVLLRLAKWGTDNGQLQLSLKGGGVEFKERIDTRSGPGGLYWKWVPVGGLRAGRFAVLLQPASHKGGGALDLVGIVPGSVQGKWAPPNKAVGGRLPGFGPDVIVTPTSDLMTTEPGGTATFRVRLGCRPSAQVALKVKSSDPGEGVADKRRLVFSPANWREWQTVTLAGRDDKLKDRHVAYKIALTASSTCPAYKNINAPDVSAWNLDDEFDLRIPPDAVELRGRWYKVYKDRKTWHEARRFCEGLGGDLVTITSKEESDFVTGLAQKAGEGAWIGLTDERVEGTWEWVTGEQVAFIGWAPGEPRNLAERQHCARLWPEMGFAWGDEAARGLSSKHPIPFVCEWQPGAPRRAPATGALGAEWQTIFNGRDLEGWKPDGRGKVSVEDGALVAARNAGAYRPAHWKRFVLECEVTGTGSRSGALHLDLFAPEAGPGRFSLRDKYRDQIMIRFHTDGDVHVYADGRKAGRSGQHKFPIGNWLSVKIEYDKDSIKVYNGKRLCVRVVGIKRAPPQGVGLYFYVDNGLAGKMRNVRVRALSPAGGVSDVPAAPPGAPVARKPAAVEPRPLSGPALQSLSEFDSLIERGDYEGARRRAERAARDPEGAAQAGLFAVAARVAGQIEARRLAVRRAVEALRGKRVELLTTTKGKYPGTVEKVSDGEITLSVDVTAPGMGSVRTRTAVKWSDLAAGQEDKLALEGGWRAEGADAHVASAYVALRRGQVVEAAMALERSGDHPLVPRLREKVRALKELAAKALEVVGATVSGPSTEKPIIVFRARHSMKLFPVGYKQLRFPVQETDDPAGPFEGKPVYFDQKTGKDVVYQIRSHRRIGQVRFKGAAMKNMTIEVLDPLGKVVVRGGPFQGGNKWGEFSVDFAPRRAFLLRIRNHVSTWLLISNLELK